MNFKQQSLLVKMKSWKVFEWQKETVGVGGNFCLRFFLFFFRHESKQFDSQERSEHILALGCRTSISDDAQFDDFSGWANMWHQFEYIFIFFIINSNKVKNEWIHDICHTGELKKRIKRGNVKTFFWSNSMNCLNFDFVFCFC